MLIYGSTAKTNLSKIEKAQRGIPRAIFSRRNSIPYMTVFELFIVENIKELFKQVMFEAPKSSCRCQWRGNIYGSMEYEKSDAGAIQSDCSKEKILRKKLFAQLILG